MLAFREILQVALLNYFRLLDKFQVIISQQDRINKILLDGEKICNKRKLSIKKDMKLLHEVSNLVEKPNYYYKI